MQQRDLVVRAQRGDVDAFGILVSGRVGHLAAVARLILRSGDQADDAVQDALVAAWVGLRGLRDPDRFDAWTYRLLVRACRRAASRRHARTLAEIAVSEELPPLVDDRQQDLANRDLIDRALRRLTVDERTVLVMRHYLDMSLGEAADALGIPLGTVKSRLSRATAAMRTALEADARTPAGGELIR